MKPYKTRLQAVTGNGAEAWLLPLPSSSLGTALEDYTLRICVGLRLGRPLVNPHRCFDCSDSVVKGAIIGSHAHGAPVNILAIRSLTRRLPVYSARLGSGAHLSPRAHRDQMTQGRLASLYHRGWYGTSGLGWDRDSSSLTWWSRCHSDRPRGRKSRTATEARCFGPKVFFYPLAFESFDDPGPVTFAMLHGLGDQLNTITGNHRSGSFMLQSLPWMSK